MKTLWKDVESSEFQVDMGRWNRELYLLKSSQH
nr:MAG TPA: hypothetical protein [Caudoviricetes sp.]